MNHLCSFVAAALLIFSTSFAQAQDESGGGGSNQRPWFGVHTAIGFPNPINFGVDFMTADESFGGSIRGGSFERTFSGVTAGTSNLELQLRHHPWKSAFYYGVSMGQRKFKGEKSDSVLAQDVTISGEGNGKYITPQIGWIWFFNNGINIGMELGYMFPVNTESSFNSNATAPVTNHQDYVRMQKDVTDMVDYLGKMALPHLTLIRLGWSY